MKKAIEAQLESILTYELKLSKRQQKSFSLDFISSKQAIVFFEGGSFVIGLNNDVFYYEMNPDFKSYGIYEKNVSKKVLSSLLNFKYNAKKFFRKKSVKLIKQFMNEIYVGENFYFAFEDRTAYSDGTIFSVFDSDLNLIWNFHRDYKVDLGRRKRPSLPPGYRPKAKSIKAEYILKSEKHEYPMGIKITKENLKSLKSWYEEINPKKDRSFLNDYEKKFSVFKLSSIDFSKISLSESFILLEKMEHKIESMTNSLNNIQCEDYPAMPVLMRRKELSSIQRINVKLAKEILQEEIKLYQAVLENHEKLSQEFLNKKRECYVS